MSRKKITSTTHKDNIPATLIFPGMSGEKPCRKSFLSDDHHVTIREMEDPQGNKSIEVEVWREAK